MKKIDYKHGKFTILTNRTDGFDYEEYLDFCEMNDIEPGGKDSDKFHEWCNEESQVNFDCDMENIKNCKQYNVPVLVTGTLGLWDGKHEIVPTREKSVYDAIQRCILNDFCYIDAEFNDGRINVSVAHHDGMNTFTIVALSKKGQDKVGEDYKPCDMKRLPYLYAIGV